MAVALRVRCSCITLLIFSTLVGGESALAQAMSSTPEVKGNFQTSVGTCCLSTGYMSSKGNTIVSRTLNAASGYILLGHKSGYLTPFLIGDFVAAVQATDSSRVSGTNLSGYGVSGGVGLAAHWGQFYLSGASSIGYV